MYSQSRTYYFIDIEDARDAADALEEAGYTDVEVHSRDGESFMDKLREFFGGAPETGHESGAVLVIDSADERALAIIEQYQGQASGTTGTATSMTADTANASSTSEQRMPLREERVSVGKERVADGEFRVGKEVVTEHQSIDVPVTREEVYVERRAVSGTEAADPQELGEGNEIRIPLTHEEAHVEKRAVTSEEIVVGKRVVQETQTVGADVRKERARFESDTDIDSANVRDDLGSSTGR